MTSRDGPGFSDGAQTPGSPTADEPHPAMTRVGPAPPLRPAWRLLKNRAFVRLWLAQVVASLGDWVGLLAILAFAARLSARPEAGIAIVMTARMVPGLLLAPLGGILADRWDRRRTMIGCNLGRAATLAILPAVHSLALLAVVALALEIQGLVWTPSKEASVPNLVRGSDLPAANSLSLVATFATFPLGSLVFAALAVPARSVAGLEALAPLGIAQEAVALWVNSATFVVSALLIVGLDLPRRGPPTRMKRAPSRLQFAEGVRFVTSDRLVRSVLLGVGLSLAGGGATIPLGPVFADEVLGAGTEGFGLLMTGLGLGTAISVVAISLTRRRLPIERLFPAAVTASGVAIILTASVSTLPGAVILVATVGFAAGTAYATGFALLQQHVADELRGRTFAALYATIRASLLAALALWPVFTSAFESVTGIGAVGTDGEPAVAGVRIALWFAGVIVTLAGVLTIVNVGRSVRRSESGG